MISTDFHIHTNLSLCAKREATLEGYIEVGKKLGLRKMGFADHFWDATIPYVENSKCQSFYGTQDLNHLLELKPKIKEYGENTPRLYFGCEVDYSYKLGAPAISEAAAEQFDFIIVPNSHTHLVMPEELYQPYEKHAEFMVKAYDDIVSCPLKKYITAVAHPFEAVCCPYPRAELLKLISDDTFKRLFTKTAEAGIAFEVNQECIGGALKSEVEWEQRLRMFGIARDMGCKFIFGSDAHSHLHLEVLQNTKELMEALSITEADIADIAR